MKNSTASLLLLSITSLLIASLSCQKSSVKTSATHTVIYLHEEKKETRSSQSLLNTFSSTGNVILKFYADWCGPCTRMSTVIKSLLSSDLAATMPDFTLININRDHFLDLGKTFNINSIPTLIFLRNGKEIGRYDGKPLTENAFAQLITTTFNT
jgi:thioredoxin-like negative regulator of GroEL